jgi:tRNA threonylcarbamoyladenosine biosynthesis protein TsaB
LETTNMVLDENSFGGLLASGKLAFFGNGSEKFKDFCKHENALFLELFPSASDLCPITFRLFNSRAFTELAYSEPLYGKEFYSPPPRPVV